MKVNKFRFIFKSIVSCCRYAIPNVNLGKKSDLTSDGTKVPWWREGGTLQFLSGTTANVPAPEEEWWLITLFA